MRISDWSSDVCSSDLIELPAPVFAVELPRRGQRTNNPCPNGNARAGNARASGDVRLPGIKRLTAGNTRRKTGQCFCLELAGAQVQQTLDTQIGTASCRERVCQDV